MRKVLLSLLISTLIITFYIPSCFADNPIVQTIYTADPAPMVYNGVCYVYTTHDEDVLIDNFFTMNDWRCYSTTDMANWTDHGTVLSYTDFSGQAVKHGGSVRGKKRQILFLRSSGKESGGEAIGVAVSDSPTGPFKDALGKPLIDRGAG